jgi:hypothetical protein
LSYPFPCHMHDEVTSASSNYYVDLTQSSCSLRAAWDSFGLYSSPFLWMDQATPWSYSRISQHFVEVEIHYCVHKRRSLVPILSQIKPVRVALIEKHCEPTWEKRKVTVMVPEKGRFCHLQIWEHEGPFVCGRQSNEEGGKEGVYLNCAHLKGKEGKRRKAPVWWVPGKGSVGAHIRANVMA